MELYLTDTPAQEVFRRLASFGGGWTLEAAEAVGATGDGAADILDARSHLLEQSLIVTEAGPDQTLRYRMLEPVRQYAWERLVASGELQAVQRRHAEFYVALAEDAELQLQGPEQKAWMDRLERELGNIRLALRSTVEQREVELAERLGSALYWFWATRGYTSEGGVGLNRLWR